MFDESLSSATTYNREELATSDLLGGAESLSDESLVTTDSRERLASNLVKGAELLSDEPPSSITIYRGGELATIDLSDSLSVKFSLSLGSLGITLLLLLRPVTVCTDWIERFIV